MEFYGTIRRAPGGSAVVDLLVLNPPPASPTTFHQFLLAASHKDPVQGLPASTHTKLMSWAARRDFCCSLGSIGTRLDGGSEAASLLGAEVNLLCSARSMSASLEELHGCALLVARMEKSDGIFECRHFAWNLKKYPKIS